MKKFSVILIFFVVLISSSCVTYPKMAKIDPRIFENDLIRIEFAIGKKVYNFSVHNKTDNEISIANKSSIISINGQSKNLFDKVEDLYIPPNSWVLFSSNQDVFFNQNMYTRFLYFYPRLETDATLINKNIGN